LQARGIDFTVEFPVAIEGSTRCRFDFFLPIQCVFLEIDGPHHHAPVRYAGMSLEKAQHVFHQTQRRDALKDDWATENGMLVYRIRWDENIEKRLGQLFRV
jgi:very-short-patch-repair endonuclease